MIPGVNAGSTCGPDPARTNPEPIWLNHAGFRALPNPLDDPESLMIPRSQVRVLPRPFSPIPLQVGDHAVAADRLTPEVLLGGQRRGHHERAGVPILFWRPRQERAHPRSRPDTQQWNVASVRSELPRSQEAAHDRHIARTRGAGAAEAGPVILPRDRGIGPEAVQAFYEANGRGGEAESRMGEAA